MKLSEYKNEDALDLLADILEPLSDIMTDEQFVELTKNKETIKMDIVRYILKNHSKEIIKIFARIEGVPAEKYDQNIIGMTKNLLDLINDKEMADFFISQVGMGKEHSGSATETTEGTEKA